MSHTQQTVWHGLAITLPQDWELLQYSRDPDQGRLTFADRSDYRLELSWQSHPSRPSLKRMLGDYRALLAQDDAVGAVEPVEAPGWKGMAVYPLRDSERVEETRYLRFEKELGKSLEAVFRWPDASPDRGFEEAVLETVTPCAERDGLAAWTAWGMAISVPVGWRPVDCRVQPADVQLTFAERADANPSVEFSRRGFLHHWFDGDLAGWIARETGTVGQCSHRSRADHHAVHSRVDEAAAGIAGRLGRRQQRQLAAWVCPRDGRLYAVRAESTGRTAVARAELRCCRDFSWEVSDG